MIDNRNSACEGSAEPSLSLATLAKPRNAAVRQPAAELRQPVTTWQLLVWTYQAQKAHLGEGDAPAGHRWGLSPTAVVMQRLQLGASIDGGRSFAPSGRAGGTCDADALGVHGHVLGLGRHARRLIDTASLGQVPDWQPYYPPSHVSGVFRMRKGKMVPVMLYDENRHPLNACKIQITGFAPKRAHEWIEHHRAIYTEWWAALSALHDQLADAQRLKRWVVQGVGAESEPWVV